MSDSKRIVITGVSRGLGRALVDEFIKGGHTVCGCSRSADAVAELSRFYEADGHFEVVDVTDDRQVGAWAQRVLAGGTPQLLINNAAIINQNAPLWEVPPEEFSAVIDINIKGVYHVLRHFVPALIERGEGVIVNLSSGWGRSAAPDVAPYCATKWAMEGLTQALAMELPHGVAAIALNPGVIHTKMLESCFGRGAESYPGPEQWARLSAPFLLDLSYADNGDPLTAPGA